jgi:hypothetical protein
MSYLNNNTLVLGLAVGVIVGFGIGYVVTFKGVDSSDVNACARGC